MATTNRDFRVKNGIVVEGSTATVNGNSVLTTASSLDSLGDVVITSATTDQVLKFNGTNWINSTDATGGGGGDLDGLSDVTITSPATGAFLRYSGTAWVDSDQTITLGGNFTTSGAFATTLTTTATTSVTLPTTGTLATLDGSETFTNKTLTSPVVNTPSLTLSTTSNTADGRLSWDTTYHHSLIGDGTNSRVVSTLPGYAIAAKTSGSPYTLLAADANTIIRINTAGAYTVNIPTNSTAYTIGTQIHFVQTGNGQVTIQALTGGTTTIISTGATTTAPKLRTTNSMATAIKLDTETWIVTGDVV